MIGPMVDPKLLKQYRIPYPVPIILPSTNSLNNYIYIYIYGYGMMGRIMVQKAANPRENNITPMRAKANKLFGGSKAKYI